MVRQDRPDRRGGGYKRGKQDDRHQPKSPKTNTRPIDENSPVIAVFRTFQTELDAKHDKHERLVKLSRDVTIDSKRVIFLLHRISRDDDKKQAVLEEAEAKIADIKQKLCQIGGELQGEDLYQFLRAVSPGIQEFIEGLMFYHYIKTKKLLGHEELENQLRFDISKEVKKAAQQEEDLDKIPEDKTTSETEIQIAIADSKMDTQTALPTTPDDPDADTCSTNVDEKGTPENLKINLHIPPSEYMLGMADFTGELMRMCIFSVGSGDRDTPFQLVSFMREIYDGFQLLGNTPNREVVRKMQTMRQSLKKVENACYTLHVRGSEIPQHMLLDVISSVESSGKDFNDGDD